MAGNLILRVFNVEHGACAMLLSPSGDRLAMIDCGHNVSTGWRPSTYIKEILQRTRLDYLFITNADLDHISDLNGLWEENVHVHVVYRNPTPDVNVLRLIKLAQGELTEDIERYLSIHQGYNANVDVPFDLGMGGVTCKLFWNTYPEFDSTNELSLVVFINYCGFQIVFPGDLKKAGWRKLLQDQNFVTELGRTTILVASHHGRENGFCEDVFDYLTPQAVVISDKPIEHETQQTVPDYRAVVNEDGVFVRSQNRRRHVLTTRRDGDIIFNIDAAGNYFIDTTNG